MRWFSNHIRDAFLLKQMGQYTEVSGRTESSCSTPCGCLPSPGHSAAAGERSRDQQYETVVPLAAWITSHGHSTQSLHLGPLNVTKLSQVPPTPRPPPAPSYQPCVRKELGIPEPVCSPVTWDSRCPLTGLREFSETPRSSTWQGQALAGARAM